MRHLIWLTLIFTATLTAASWVAAAAPARAASPDKQMRQAVLALRGLIDRKGAQNHFTYPGPATVYPGRLAASRLWPDDPWTGRDLRPGTRRGNYRYTVTRDRRRYRLVGYLNVGTIVLSGSMPRSIMRAYDHRGEEGLNLIREYVEDYAAHHAGRYPPPVEVADEGAVRLRPERRYWPSNPWDHKNMARRGDRGSYSYRVSADRSSYTLRLHRALKDDYVLRGSRVTSPWRRLLDRLEDEILRRSARILQGYVDRWSLEHSGALPTVAEMAPADAVGAAHTDWPRDPIGGDSMTPGTGPGSYTYAPGLAGVYTLSVHLHSEDFEAGGTAPSPMAEADPAQ